MNKLFIILSFVLFSFFAKADLLSDLENLKPVQYPLMNPTTVQGIQGVFVRFTQSIQGGCQKHYGIDYTKTNVLDQISQLKFADEVKVTCIWPVVVRQLDQFSKRYLKLTKDQIGQNGVNLTLAARIYNFSFLSGFDSDQTESDDYVDIFAVQTHMSILNRMLRQILPTAIKVTNPWYAQNSIARIEQTREIAGWISEITPWSYLMKNAFAAQCGDIGVEACQKNKLIAQTVLKLALEKLKKNDVLYGYVTNIRLSNDEIKNNDNIIEHMSRIESIYQGLQVLKGLSGESVPYMMGPQIEVAGNITTADFFEIQNYLTKGTRDILEKTSAMLITERFSCQTILRTFVSLHREFNFSLKNEIEEYNPFKFVPNDKNDLKSILTDGLSVDDIISKVNCKKIRDLYQVPIEDAGLATRFLAYEGRMLLATTAIILQDAGSAKNESLLFAQVEDVANVIQTTKDSLNMINVNTPYAKDPRVIKASNFLVQYLTQFTKG